MSVCFSYECFDNLPDYAENPCGFNRLTGISDIAILNKEHTITDFTNATQWQDAIDDGFVKIIRNVKVEYPEASEVTIDNPRAKGAESILVKFNQLLNLEDPNVCGENDDFHRNLNNIEFFMAWYYFEEKEIRVVEEAVTAIIKPPVSPFDGDVQKYMGTLNWRSAPDEYPTLYSAPAGIFE